MAWNIDLIIYTYLACIQSYITKRMNPFHLFWTNLKSNIVTDYNCFRGAYFVSMTYVNTFSTQVKCSIDFKLQGLFFFAKKDNSTKIYKENRPKCQGRKRRKNVW